MRRGPLLAALAVASLPLGLGACAPLSSGGAPVSAGRAATVTPRPPANSPTPAAARDTATAGAPTAQATLPGASPTVAATATRTPEPTVTQTNTVAPTSSPTQTPTQKPSPTATVAAATTGPPVGTATVTPMAPLATPTAPARAPTPAVIAVPGRPLSSLPATGFVRGFFPMALEAIDTTRLATLLPATFATQHFVVHYLPGSFGGRHVRTFARDAEAAVVHIESLLNVTWAHRDDYYLAYATFAPPDTGVKGYTLSNEHMIFQMYDGSGTPLERQYLSSHELTHQIAYDTLGQAASTMLLEGLAMYCGQQYLLSDGDISLDGLSRAALTTGQLIPLTDLSDGSVPYLGRFFHRRPYDEAGSFVQYLIGRYGLEAFKRVYLNGAYTAVYGESLQTLSDDWIQYLQSPRAVGPFAADGAAYLQSLADVQEAFFVLTSTVSNGQRVPMAAYRDLDEARVAADRGDTGTASRALQEFKSSLPAQ